MILRATQTILILVCCTLFCKGQLSEFVKSTIVPNSTSNQKIFIHVQKTQSIYNFQIKDSNDSAILPNGEFKSTELDFTQFFLDLKTFDTAYQHSPASAMELFIYIKEHFNQSSNELIAGELKVSKTVPLYSANSNWKSLISHKKKENLEKYRINNSKNNIKYGEGVAKMKVEDTSDRYNTVATLHVKSVQLEINDGAIENLYVVGALSETSNNLLIFKINYPVSYSFLRDYGSPFRFFATENTYSPNYMFFVSDLLKYIPKLYSNNKNYAPDNKVYYLSPGTDTLLYREETSQILKAKVYTDFVGINEDQPNGLIQTEVSRKFIINPARYKIGRYGTLINFGWVNFFEPEIAITKVEQNNKSIPVRTKYNIVDNNFKEIRYLSIIELMQFQNFRASLNINGLLLDLPRASSTFMCNFKVQYGRTSVTDTIRKIDGSQIVNTSGVKNYNLNTFQYIPEVTLSIKPDTRFGMSVSASMTFFNLKNDDVLQVGNIKKFLMENQVVKGSYIGSFSFNANLKSGIIIDSRGNGNQSKGEFFFKCSYNVLNTETSQNYFQALLGYSFNLLKKN